MTPTAYRYQLEKGSKKHRCPRCQQRTFTRYVDTETGELMPEHLGRCDREQKCQYWSRPNRSEFGPTSAPIAPPPPPPPPSFIAPEVMAASVAHGSTSTFARWMAQRFGADLTADAVARYRLGASKHWDGANVFWQIDTSERIRGGKVMQYDATGHRVKVPTNRVTWVHSVLKMEGYNLKQCFFGEHLLPLRPADPVAIVESEKTAIVASLYIPAFVWMATGGKNGCKWKTDPTVTSVLRGRQVALFPDLGAFQDWQTLADTLGRSGAQVTVNPILENNATDHERANGLDLADYLLRFEPDLFRTAQIRPAPSVKTEPPPKPEPAQPKPISWDVPTFGPEHFTAAPVRLDPCTTITDPRLFIEAHLRTVEGNKGNPVYLPYLERLHTYHRKQTA
jgi:hypothetical protein